MLAFFRKYQKYFYTVITVMIVISFSFFGTYGAIQDSDYQDTVAFKAIDGTPVYRSELERMALFIGTDAEDMRQFGGTWGPNFFNDGVIEKDFLETGIAAELISSYKDQLRSDFESRQKREARFKPYVHPNNTSISAVEIWNRTNPKKVEQFRQLVQADDLLSDEAIQNRIDLYLSERSYSGNDMKQSLMYLEQMNRQYMQPDPNLRYADLSLFGYQTAEDWLGSRFVHLAAEYIINSAIIAEQKGYQVPKEEVIADLMRNAKRSYLQNKHYTRLGVSNPTQYFQEHLRRMHMDQTQAVNTWRQVMLFRRLFQDVGNSVVTDPFTVQQFQEFARDSVTGEVYSLPEDLQLNSFRDLQLYQVYIRAVAAKIEDPLALPKTYLSKDEIAPELIQQSYLVEIGEVSKSQLQTRVGVREMWDWQVSDEGWMKIVKEYPELNQDEATNGTERRIRLDALDEITASRVDGFSRKQIVEEHPEWVADALETVTKQRKVLAVRTRGGSNPLPGVEDRIAFLEFLNDDQAAQARVYSPDDRTYYMITVVEKSESPQIMTFEQAKSEGVLGELLDEQLNNYYSRIREASPDKYQLPDGDWKTLAVVHDEVAERYFSKVLKAIQDQTGIKSPDAAATKRFLSYVEEVRQVLMKDPSQREVYVSDVKGLKDIVIEDQRSLSDQWKLVVAPFTLDRTSRELETTQLQANSWTNPEALPNGAISFRHIKKRSSQPNGEALVRGVEKAHTLLSRGAQFVYSRKVLQEIQDKGAISLEYLNPKS